MGFLTNYFQKLRESDEKTKHNSALRISIMSSIIVFIILFFLFKNELLNILNPNNKIKEDVIVKEENNIESPITSFLIFFKETGNQFSNIKSTLSDTFNNVKTYSSTGEVVDNSKNN